MKVKELRELLEKFDDDVQVYVEADHGQMPEVANSFSMCIEKDLPYYGEELGWRDLEDLSETAPKAATAVLISA